MEDHILELNENAEKLRAITFRNRITQAVGAVACLIFAIMVQLSLGAGLPAETPFWFLSVEPSIISLLLVLVGLVLAVSALLTPSPQIE